MNLFDVVSMLESLNADHLQEVLEDHFQFERFTVCQVKAEGFEE